MPDDLGVRGGRLELAGVGCARQLRWRPALDGAAGSATRCLRELRHGAVHGAATLRRARRRAHRTARDRQLIIGDAATFARFLTRQNHASAFLSEENCSLT